MTRRKGGKRRIRSTCVRLDLVGINNLRRSINVDENGQEIRTFDEIVVCKNESIQKALVLRKLSVSDEVDQVIDGEM